MRRLIGEDEIIGMFLIKIRNLFEDKFNKEGIYEIRIKIGKLILVYFKDGENIVNYFLIREDLKSMM